LQVGDHRVLFRANDPASLLSEVKVQTMRSKLNPPAPLPAEIVRPPLPPVQAPPPAAPAPVLVGSAKSPGVAAVLSALWPGLGQIYNGQIGLGILFIVLQVVNGLLTFVLIGFVTGLAVWIWSMVDAHNAAVRYNQARGMIS
jgi:TM2 domain-containing membrane protein YozV